MAMPEQQILGTILWRMIMHQQKYVCVCVFEGGSATQGLLWRICMQPFNGCFNNVKAMSAMFVYLCVC